jgi:two-component system, OmpR family, alkaline phosphatase synthesis response regulator PhoP
MSRPRILLVEDEPNIARGLIFNLEEEGYAVTHAVTGEEALKAAKRASYSLVVLDLMLPGMDGLEVCRRLRQEDPRIPILILTALSDEKDKVRGLAEGADDYLTKPFSLEEFLLRVGGMLRRSQWYRSEANSGNCRFGDNVIDMEKGKASTAHGEITLTDLEMKMLRTFVGREGEVLSRAELLSEIWGISPDTETRTLDNFIVRMRKYFERDPAEPVHFLTVRGKGYKFQY